MASALLLAACVEGPGVMPAPEARSLEAFDAEVQPVLARRCANPTCHGRAGRPLELYAPQRHRRDAALVHLDAPLTSEELWSNYVRVLFFTDDGAGGCPLVDKPRAHGEGAWFPDPDDPDLGTLERWAR